MTDAYPWLGKLPPEFFGRAVGPLSRLPIFLKDPAMSPIRRLVLEERARERRHWWDRHVRPYLNGAFHVGDQVLTSETIFGIARLPAQLVEKPLDGDVLFPWRRDQ